MKTADVRMDEVLRRSRAREQAIRRRRQRAVVLGGGVLGVLTVAVVGIGIAAVMGHAASSSPGATVDLMGSALAGGSVIGYVVAGLLGLVLGVTVTVLAVRVGGVTPTGGFRETPEVRGAESSDGKADEAEGGTP